MAADRVIEYFVQSLFGTMKHIIELQPGNTLRLRVKSPNDRYVPFFAHLYE